MAERRYRRGWFALGVVVILTATACASESDRGTLEAAEVEQTETTRRTTTTRRPTTTTTEAGPPTLAMGETLSFTLTDFNDNETEVSVTVANPATFTESPIEYGLDPQSGMFLVLDVTVVVGTNSAGTYSAGPNEFKFVAVDGTVADPGFASGFDPMLSYINLSAGQQVSGKIVFDINPSHQAGARIQINDVGANYGQPFAYWGLP